MQLKAKAKAKAKTVKEMAAGWKKTRDEPVPDDHAEGEDEEPKEEDATVADDEHRSYPKVRKCARMIKSGQVIFSSSMKRAPRILLPQGYLRVNSSTQSFSRTPEASLCLLLEIPSVWSFQDELWGLHQQISDYWVGLGCGQNPGKPASFEWCKRRGDVYQKDGYYHVKTIATAIVPCHGLAWWPSQPHQGWEFAGESIHVEQALEPVWHWS